MIIVRVICSVLAVAILIGVAERILPLRAVERDRWEWHYRPQRMFPGIDSFSVRHVALFGGLGLLTGYVLAEVIGAVIGGILVAATRWIVGVIPRQRLPRTLDNGTTRAMFSASSMLFDSESAANIYAAGWLRNATIHPRPVRGPILPALMIRRVCRRSYIPALFLVTVLLGYAAVPAFDNGARIAVLLAWAVLSSAVWRATSLGMSGEIPWRGAVLGVVTAVGVGAQWLLGVPDYPVVFALLAAVTIMSGAILRGRPRANDDFAVIEDGLFGGIPFGMIGYWFSGWVAVIPAVLAVGLVP